MEERGEAAEANEYGYPENSPNRQPRLQTAKVSCLRSVDVLISLSPVWPAILKHHRYLQTSGTHRKKEMWRLRKARSKSQQWRPDSWTTYRETECQTSKQEFRGDTTHINTRSEFCLVFMNAKKTKQLSHLVNNPLLIANATVRLRVVSPDLDLD